MINDFQGKHGFIWWTGVVEDRHDPLFIGRCKVRILGWHSSDPLNMPTSSLPWAYPMMPITASSQTQVGDAPLGPVEGTWVVGFFKDGEDAQEPIMMGTLGGIPTESVPNQNVDDNFRSGFHDPRLNKGDFQYIPPNKTEQLTGTVLSGTQKITETRSGGVSESGTSKGRLQYVGTRKLEGHEVPGKPQSIIFNSDGTGSEIIESDLKKPYPIQDNLEKPTTSRYAIGISDSESGIDDADSIITIKNNKRTFGQLNVPKSSGGVFDQPPSGYNAQYPYNHVFESESGHLMEFDDTPGSERIHLYHRSTSNMEYQPDGTKIESIALDNYKMVMRSDYEHIENEKVTTVDGSYDLLVNKDASSTGNFHLKVGPNSNAIVETAGGNINMITKKGQLFAQTATTLIEAVDSIILRANTVTIDTKSPVKHTFRSNVDETVLGAKDIAAMSMTVGTQENMSFSAGGGLSIGVLGAMSETIDNVKIPPSATAKSTSVKLGNITTNIISPVNTIDMSTGPGGTVSKVSIGPTLDITQTLGTGINISTTLGAVKISGLQGTSMSVTAGGKVAVDVTGLVEIKSAVTSLKDILTELIDEFLNHYHLTGTGPSDVPAPSSKVNLQLLKSLKIPTLLK